LFLTGEKSKTYISQKYKSDGQRKSNRVLSKPTNSQETRKLSHLIHHYQTVGSGFQPWMTPGMDDSQVVTGLTYKASSCDDECLVYAASCLGYTFTLRTKSSLYLRVC
jgi:hypothetical protein